MRPANTEGSEGPGRVHNDDVVESRLLQRWAHRLRAVPSHLVQRLSDWFLNVDTMEDSESGPMVPEFFVRDGSSDYRNHYQSTNYLYLQRIARLLRPTPNQSVFYDIGCGKGRVLCVMARLPFKRVVGIDLSESLCEGARRNAARMRGRVAPIDVVCADATLADVSDGHVYFFFNPFGPPTLRTVIDNIERSLRSSPRDVTVIYYHALHEDVLRATPWLEQYHVLPTLSGMRVSFWRNRPNAS